MRLKRLLFLIGVAAAASFLLRMFAFEGIYIASGSMEPQLPVGTHVFMDKITLRLRPPRRGEIIVFSAPVSSHEDMVKRVIAVPDDVVEIRAKTVWLNRAELSEDYVQHTRPRERLAGDDLGPLTVPQDHVFVLGDNRDESNDSSVWKDAQTGQPIYFVPYPAIEGLVRGFY